MTRTRFVDRLLTRIAQVGSPTCIGLDPVVERLPDDIKSSATDDAEAIQRFCTGVIDATVEFAAAYKPQSACFERLGSAGIAVLERVIAHAKSKNVPVILDAKRGDIGSTAEHYAQAVRSIGADAVTVNAYLGPLTIEPYLDAGLGVFVLVRTSNTDSDLVQSNELASGGTVAEMMAKLVNKMGETRFGGSKMSEVGAVVGLTKSADGVALRELMPEQIFLVPGYGAQGGSAEDLKPLLTQHDIPGRGVLVNASRSVIYAKPEGGESWTDAIAQAVQAMAADLSSCH